MKKLILPSIVLVVAVVIILPAAITGGFVPKDISYRPPDPPPGAVMIKVWREDTGQVETMELEEYLKGVVAAEMPASFELEALKAQAVAARTFAIRRMKIFGGAGCLSHPEADISTNPTEGQAWASADTMRERWGYFSFAKNWAKIEEAVKSTAGLIIVYRGEPIDPVFHSCCGGRTENSEDVWQNATPYLRSVACPHDRGAEKFVETTSFRFSDLVAAFGPEVGVLSASGSKPVVQILEQSQSGKVKRLRLGEAELRGTDFRLKLGLKSTGMTFQVSGDSLAVTTKGYGHGVGLCQYGADGFAKQGYGYEEILKHYYTGVEIIPMFGD